MHRDHDGVGGRLRGVGGLVRPGARPPWLDRRRWLKVSGTVLAGGWAGACASGPKGRLDVPSPWTPLQPVRVSRDRVIRVVAGLRPYRAEGFVVRAERLAGKLLVHNYGHGGRRSHAVVGHGRDGGRPGHLRRARGRRGRDRRGRRGAGHGPAPAAPRPQGDDLRPRTATRHDLEHRRRAVVPVHRLRQPGGPLRPSVRTRRPPGLPPLPEPGRRRLRRPLDRQLLPPRTASGPRAATRASATSFPSGRRWRATSIPSPPASCAGWQPCSSSRTGICRRYSDGTFASPGARWSWGRSPIWSSWPRWPSR